MPFLDSLWGYSFRSLTDPGGAVSDSDWGYQYVGLSDPAVTSDSLWGFWGTVTLVTPHHPITVLLAGQERHVPVQVLINGVMV